MDNQDNAAVETVRGPYIVDSGPCKGALVVEGRIVPHVRGAAEANDMVNLFLDDRFGIVVPAKSLDQWAWFLANAMAVAAGFTCFGDSDVSLQRNPYGRHAVAIDDVLPVGV